MPTVSTDIAALLEASNDAAARPELGINDTPVPATSRFVFEGDSITAGGGISGSPAGGWPAVAAALPEFALSGQKDNVAVSGSFLNNPANGALGVTQRYAANVYPKRPEAGETVVLFLMVGTNDLSDGRFETDPAAWISDLTTYINTAKADGFKVALATPLHEPERRTTLFDMISRMRQLTIWDFFVDFHQAVGGTTANTTNFNADKVHPLAPGYALMAQEAALIYHGKESWSPVTALGGATHILSPTTTSYPRGLPAVRVSNELSVGVVSIGGTQSAALSSTVVNIGGVAGSVNALMRFHTGTGDAASSAMIGVVVSAGSAAIGTGAYNTVLSAYQSKDIDLATSPTGTTQTVRVRIKANGSLELVPLAAAPATPSNGQIYYNSTTHKFQGYSNGAWVDLH